MGEYERLLAETKEAEAAAMLAYWQDKTRNGRTKPKRRKPRLTKEQVKAKLDFAISELAAVLMDVSKPTAQKSRRTSKWPGQKGYAAEQAALRAEWERQHANRRDWKQIEVKEGGTLAEYAKSAR
jgi:hypothetical protein